MLRTRGLCVRIELGYFTNEPRLFHNWWYRELQMASLETARAKCANSAECSKNKEQAFGGGGGKSGVKFGGVLSEIG